MKKIDVLREILLDKVVFKPRDLTKEEFNRLKIGKLVFSSNRFEL